MSPLLRAFQSEIDSLTRRGSTAETYFLNAYKKFIEIPGIWHAHDKLASLFTCIMYCTMTCWPRPFDHTFFRSHSSP